MRLETILEGKLDELLEREYQNCSHAVTTGIKNATNGLKTSLRSQVKSSGLGGRLANTWRDDVYPSGKNSVSAAGVVYTKARKILEGFEYASVICSQKGFWLAIPPLAIKKRVFNKRMTPALYEKWKGVRLRFVYRANGVSLLVHEQKRKTLIAFILVPQVKMPKLINFVGESEKWQARVPTLILENWKDE